MKRKNLDYPKLRRSTRRNKINENLYGNTFVYLKFFLIWAIVLLADFILEFRFEYLWPFWLLLRSVYDSFKYQGLAFSIFFICIALTSDMICLLTIPVHWLFFAASTYVWVQFIWHTERGICLPTISLWLLFVYIEASIRLRELKNVPFHLDLCRPFAAHCIGYPMVTLGFGFKSYIAYRLRQKKQKHISKENNFYYDLLKRALPDDIDVQIEDMQDLILSEKNSKTINKINGHVVSCGNMDIKTSEFWNNGIIFSNISNSNNRNNIYSQSHRSKKLNPPSHNQSTSLLNDSNPLRETIYEKHNNSDYLPTYNNNVVTKCYKNYLPNSTSYHYKDSLQEPVVSPALSDKQEPGQAGFIIYTISKFLCFFVSIVRYNFTNLQYNDTTPLLKRMNHLTINGQQDRDSKPYHAESHEEASKTKGTVGQSMTYRYNSHQDQNYQRNGYSRSSSSSSSSSSYQYRHNSFKDGVDLANLNQTTDKGNLRRRHSQQYDTKLLNNINPPDLNIDCEKVSKALLTTNFEFCNSYTTSYGNSPSSYFYDKPNVSRHRRTESSSTAALAGYHAASLTNHPQNGHLILTDLNGETQFGKQQEANVQNVQLNEGTSGFSTCSKALKNIFTSLSNHLCNNDTSMTLPNQNVAVGDISAKVGNLNSTNLATISRGPDLKNRSGRYDSISPTYNTPSTTSTITTTTTNVLYLPSTHMTVSAKIAMTQEYINSLPVVGVPSNSNSIKNTNPLIERSNKNRPPNVTESLSSSTSSGSRSESPRDKTKSLHDECSSVSNSDGEDENFEEAATIPTSNFFSTLSHLDTNSSLTCLLNQSTTTTIPSHSDIWNYSLTSSGQTNPKKSISQQCNTLLPVDKDLIATSFTSTSSELQKMEIDVKKLKYDLQASRTCENDLRNQITHLQNSEKCAKNEINLLKTENESLLNKISSLQNAKQVEKQQLAAVEKKLLDEQKMRSKLESQLFENRKILGPSSTTANSTPTYMSTHHNVGGSGVRSNTSLLAKEDYNMAYSTSSAYNLLPKHECSDFCKNRRKDLENDVRQLCKDTRDKEEQIWSLEKELKTLRSFKEQHNDNELLITVNTLKTMNARLETNLSAETKLKMDLFSVLSEAKCNLEINQNLLMKRDKEIKELKFRLKEYMSTMGNSSNIGAAGSNYGGYNSSVGSNSVYALSSPSPNNENAGAHRSVLSPSLYSSNDGSASASNYSLYLQQPQFLHHQTTITTSTTCNIFISTSPSPSTNSLSSIFSNTFFTPSTFSPISNNNLFQSYSPSSLLPSTTNNNPFNSKSSNSKSQFNPTSLDYHNPTTSLIDYASLLASLSDSYRNGSGSNVSPSTTTSSAFLTNPSPPFSNTGYPTTGTTDFESFVAGCLNVPGFLKSVNGVASTSSDTMYNATQFKSGKRSTDLSPKSKSPKDSASTTNNFNHHQ